ncbi:MAG: hypothetical protein SynsKO_35870 [Synoicihabitans sp.]
MQIMKVFMFSSSRVVRFLAVCFALSNVSINANAKVDLLAELKAWDEASFTEVADYYVGIFHYDGEHAWFEGQGNVDKSAIRETFYTLLFLDGYGALNGPAARFPDSLRAFILRWLASKQAADGFFYDHPEQASELTTKRRIDFLSCARRINEMLGGSPRFPYPESKESAPPELASPERYRAWLESLAFTNPYGDGAMIAMYQNVIARFPDQHAYGEELAEFLPTRQQPGTGLWGTDPKRRDYRYISGAMKIDQAVSKPWMRGVKPYRLAQEIWTSTLAAVLSGEGDQSVWVRNAPQVMLATIDQLPEPPSPELWQQIIEQVRRDTERLRNADGGFGRSIPLASNANDTKLMAESTRRLYYQLMGFGDSDQFRDFPGLATILPRLESRIRGRDNGSHLKD